MNDKNPACTVLRNEDGKACEDEPRYFCVVQHRMESDLWTAIDKLSDFAQRNELMMTKVLQRLDATIGFAVAVSCALLVSIIW